MQTPLFIFFALEIMIVFLCTQDLYSLSSKTSYRKISWSLEAARFMFRLFQSLWNLTDTSAAPLTRSLPNFRAIRLLKHPISQLQDFLRIGGMRFYTDTHTYTHMHIHNYLYHCNMHTVSMLFDVMYLFSSLYIWSITCCILTYKPIFCFTHDSGKSLSYFIRGCILFICTHSLACCTDIG